MASFDARNQRVATALARIFAAADVKFGLQSFSKTLSVAVISRTLG